MATYGTIWSKVAGLSYAQANARAASLGGQLISDYRLDGDPGATYSKTSRWATDGYTASEDDRYSPVWVGTEHRADGWYWIDGTKIGVDNFYVGDVNIDNDPTNDSSELIAYSGHLVGYDPFFEGKTLQQQSTGYVMDYFTPKIVGTSTVDFVVDLGLGVESVKLGDGHDVIRTVNGAKTIDLGAGNDYAFVTSPNVYSTLYDGAGSDVVYLDNGEIKAGLGGEEDQYQAPKVDYYQAKVGIHVDGNVATSSEIGTDSVTATKELYLGSGDDTVDVYYGGKLYLRGGNDGAYVGHSNGGSRWVDGGDGNDSLTAGYGGGTLIGGAGNDTLRLAGNWDTYFDVEMTGGAGSDTFAFTSYQATSSRKPIINDFAAKGAVQDHLDLTSYGLAASSVQDALADGSITIRASGGYTYVAIDGGEVTNDLTLMLKGTYGSEIYDNIWI